MSRGVVEGFTSAAEVVDSKERLLERLRGAAAAADAAAVKGAARAAAAATRGGGDAQGEEGEGDKEEKEEEDGSQQETFDEIKARWGGLVGRAHPSAVILLLCWPRAGSSSLCSCFHRRHAALIRTHRLAPARQRGAGGVQPHVGGG